MYAPPVDNPAGRSLFMYERFMEGLRKWHEVISNIGHLITIINPGGDYLCMNILRTAYDNGTGLFQI
jgi:hypothetical protein